MRMLTSYLFLLLIILITPSVLHAQNLSPELSDVGTKLNRAFDEFMRDWTRKRAPPVYEHENVLVEFWTRCDRTTKISILTHRSDADASKRLEAFVQYDTVKKRLEGIGDEAFAWGYGSAIAFRRGHLNVFVSTEVQLMVMSVEETQRTEFGRAEQAATNKVIARFVDAVLKCQTARCVIAPSKFAGGSVYSKRD